jgi:hypothetical protein
MEELLISKIIDRNNANRVIVKPIRGVVPHLGATLPYSELSGFKDLPTPIDLGMVLEVSSMVCVAIETIVLV